MAKKLQEFIPRAPRYVIRPGDDTIVRFAQQNQSHRPFYTRFLNISESGAAFVVPQDCVPAVGEIVKVELPVPGENERVAWFAKVVRLEEYLEKKWFLKNTETAPPPDVLIAVQFYDLPEGHQRSINRGLKHKFKTIEQEKRQRRRQAVREFLHQYFWQISAYILLSMLTLGILYLLSRPGPNYDAERGAPWGQRYNLFKSSGSSE